RQMIAKSKFLVVGYAVGIVLFFTSAGVYLAASETGDVSGLLECICLPGALLATYGLVGVHSVFAGFLFSLEAAQAFQIATTATPLLSNGDVHSHGHHSPAVKLRRSRRNALATTSIGVSGRPE